MSNPAKGQSGGGQQHKTASAQELKAAEVQEAGNAKAGAGHPEVLEGGKAEAPTEGKGQPKSAASNAPAGATSDAATTSATVGKAEKEAAAAAGAGKEQHGRGHRKADRTRPQAYGSAPPRSAHGAGEPRISSGVRLAARQTCRLGIVPDQITQSPERQQGQSKQAPDRNHGHDGNDRQGHFSMLMVFKLVMAASKTCWRLKGENQLPKVVAGVIFRDGTGVIARLDHRAA